VDEEIETEELISRRDHTKVAKTRRGGGDANRMAKDPKVPEGPQLLELFLGCGRGVNSKGNAQGDQRTLESKIPRWERIAGGNA